MTNNCVLKWKYNLYHRHRYSCLLPAASTSTAFSCIYATVYQCCDRRTVWAINTKVCNHIVHSRPYTCIYLMVRMSRWGWGLEWVQGIILHVNMTAYFSSYAFVHPVHWARSIMFSGCLSLCVPISVQLVAFSSRLAFNLWLLVWVMSCVCCSGDAVDWLLRPSLRWGLRSREPVRHCPRCSCGQPD